jgi:hypothetical protein
LTFVRFAVGFLAALEFGLRFFFLETRSSPALSTSSSLSSDSSMSDASFAISSPARFLFALPDGFCDECASGVNFSGARTARPDFLRFVAGAGELIVSAAEMSFYDSRVMIIDT